MGKADYRATGRAFVSAICLPLIFAASSEALGQSHQQKPSKSAVTASQPAVPVHFFTINEVLAKNGLGAPVRVAAAPPVVLNDATRGTDPAGPEPFGLYGFRAPEGRLWKQWRAIKAALEEEQASLTACTTDGESCSAEALRFLALKDEIRMKDGRTRIETANRIANQVLRYMSDQQQHGQRDHWSAPFASLATLRGDCEDYAILKYALLLRAGATPESLRIVLLRDTVSRQDHAVLAVKEGGEWLLLDNLRAGAMKTAELPHYKALYSLGQGGVTLLASRFATADAAVLESPDLVPATSTWGANAIEAEETAGAAQYAAMLL